MKKLALILGIAALVAAACTQKSHGGTIVNCKFGSEIPENITFSMGEDWDTTISVSGKTAKVVLPVNTTKVTFMYVDADPVHFISDGSDITIDLESGEISSSDKDGLTSRLQAMDSWESSFGEKADARLEGLSGAEEDAAIDELLEEYNAYHLDILEKNNDNILGLMALSSLQMDDDARMIEALNSLSDELKENNYVQQMMKVYDTKSKTGVGSMFVDFEIEQEPGNAKSRVKLSDYVGKGKYILVDFWASWCGPCKAEIPNIKEVYRKHKGKDFDILSIAVWDKPEDTKVAAKQLGIQWNQIINAQQLPTDLYGIEGIPHLILFGPDGTIVARGIRGAQIEEAVAAALKK